MYRKIETTTQVIQVVFPISERLLDEAVLRAVRKWWCWGSSQGLSVAQTSFYVEQDLDRPVESQAVGEALERLVKAGFLRKDGYIHPTSSVSLITGKESKGRVLMNRYFPVHGAADGAL